MVPDKSRGMRLHKPWTKPIARLAVIKGSHLDLCKIGDAIPHRSLQLPATKEPASIGAGWMNRAALVQDCSGSTLLSCKAYKLYKQLKHNGFAHPAWKSLRTQTVGSHAPVTYLQRLGVGDIC